MTLPLEYERLGGSRTRPHAERARRTVQIVERVERRRLRDRLAETHAALAARTAERDRFAASAGGWRDNFLAAARDAHRFYLAALVGWGLALLFGLILVATLVARAIGG